MCSPLLGTINHVISKCRNLRTYSTIFWIIFFALYIQNKGNILFLLPPILHVSKAINIIMMELFCHKNHTKISRIFFHYIEFGRVLYAHYCGIFVWNIIHLNIIYLGLLLILSKRVEYFKVFFSNDFFLLKINFIIDNKIHTNKV